MIKKELKLPEEFYKEEVRNDYKISSEMKKIWSIELDLFNQLDRICKKHNITYQRRLLSLYEHEDKASIRRFTC